MRAVLCRAFGPPESLTVEELPDPVAGPGEVVVDVAVAALNFFDTLIIENKYQFKPPLPFSPGAEFAGRVSALGEGADPSWLGARVAAYVGWGACRTRLAVPVEKLVRMPEASVGRSGGGAVGYLRHHAARAGGPRAPAARRNAGRAWRGGWGGACGG